MKSKIKVVIPSESIVPIHSDDAKNISLRHTLTLTITLVNKLSYFFNYKTVRKNYTIPMQINHILWDIHEFKMAHTVFHFYFKTFLGTKNDDIYISSKITHINTGFQSK